MTVAGLLAERPRLLGVLFLSNCDREGVPHTTIQVQVRDFAAISIISLSLTKQIFQVDASLCFEFRTSKTTESSAKSLKRRTSSL